MTETYYGRYGVSDSSAATLTIVINRGNALVRTLELVTRHVMQDGSCTELPMDVSGHALESGIYSGSGAKVGEFVLTKQAATGVVDLLLLNADTEKLEPGSYDYYFDTLDAAGQRYTRLKGKLEVLPK
jgi:hypothetical protein